MKANLYGHKINGFYGQQLPDGSRYLFVNGTSSQTKRMSFPVAKVCNDGTVCLEAEQQLSDFTNEQVVNALLNQ